MSVSYDLADEHMRRVGLRASSWNNKVIVAEALDRGLRVSAAQEGKRVRLTDGSLRHGWRFGSNSLNIPLANRCVNLKDVANRLLRSQGASAPENTTFNAHETHRAWQWAQHILPVVVKPNDGRQGQEVHVNIASYEDFEWAFERAAQIGQDILVEAFTRGQDHRVLVIDNQVVAATRRVAANVVGNGEASIRELISQKNVDRGVVHKNLIVDEVVERFLQRQSLSLASIPLPGERIFLRGTANLHTGGDVVDATNDLSSSEILAVEAASKAIPGLRVAGFDVLLPRRPDHDQLAIIEVNSRPMISGHHFPWEGASRDAAGAVLNAMYPQTFRTISRPMNAATLES